MAWKKGKTISFDAMVKFFLQNYNIPTKRDFDKLCARMDRFEDLLKESSGMGETGRRNRNVGKPGPGQLNPGDTSIGEVLGIIRKHREGIDFPRIKAKSGFEEKKLRNIIYRLHKLEKIRRISRGIYSAR